MKNIDKFKIGDKFRTIDYWETASYYNVVKISKYANAIVGQSDIDGSYKMFDADSCVLYVRNVLISTNNREKAENTLQGILAEIDESQIRNKRIDKDSIEVFLLDGGVIRWKKPSENIRGIECNEAYIDLDMDAEILQLIVLPMCGYCRKKDKHFI